MRQKVWPGFFVLLAVLLLAACARPAYPVVNLRASPQPALTPTSPQTRPPLRIAVAAILSPRTTYHVYENLAAYLEERLGEPVEVTQRATYAETNELIRTCQVDLGFVCTGAYIQGHQEFGMELLAVPEINGERTYRSYIIVPAESPAQRWEDLRGTVFAFTDPLSLSGYLSPLYLLHSAHSDCRTCAVFWRDGAPRFPKDRCPHCATCGRVRAGTRPAVLVPASSECSTCPLFREDGTGGPMYHVAVPLQVKGEIVGLLSVVYQDEVCQEDLGLLEAVGRQVGVGIENARLWEELQRKEAVRRELLHKAITAQE